MGLIELATLAPTELAPAASATAWPRAGLASAEQRNARVATGMSTTSFREANISSDDILKTPLGTNDPVFWRKNWSRSATKLRNRPNFSYPFVLYALRDKQA
jgi:hypothetical protein